MIKTLKKSLDIDLTYSANSLIFIIRKIPILNDLITDDIYKSYGLKRIIRYIMIIINIFKKAILKFFYFMIIFMITYQLFFENIIESSYHIYILLTVIGMFINNKLLNVTKKDYFSLNLFRMNHLSYFRANLVWNQVSNLVLNSFCIWLFYRFLLMSPFKYYVLLIIISFFIRPIGEYLNIMFFKKYKYLWYSNSNLYFGILIPLLLITALPIFKIYLSFTLIRILTIVISILGIISLYYLWNIKDIKLVYQRLFQITKIMSNKNDKDYYKQAMVEVRDKDKIIHSKKIEGKKGFDLFNTIFFERHKEILNRSARKYSLIIMVIYIVLGYLLISRGDIKPSIDSFYHNNIGCFVIIMYFINRGAIITQAMFFNCDHAMLTYNYYRQPNNLLGLFKQRLLTVMRVNLGPALVVSLGNSIVLLLLGNYDYLTIILLMLFILSLSVFFSVHYLVIYYLFQPFNKDLEVKKLSYSLATLVTYIISYQMIGIEANILLVSVVGLISTIVYILIALVLVYRYAPKTFKLN